MATRRREPAEALRLSHLAREVKTSLELAVAGLAPTGLVDDLARAAGLLDALAQFPEDAAPVVANTQRAIELSRTALGDWQKWEATRRARKGSA